MKVVNMKEFMLLPEGTIYSNYEPNICEGLYRKGGNCDYPDSIDFFFIELFPTCPNGEAPRVEDLYTRCGLFDQNLQFAVYEKEDVEKLLKLITQK